MKRIACLMIAAVLMLSLAACGGSAAKTYDLAAIQESMLNALQEKEPLVWKQENIESFYDIAAEDVKNAVCIVTMDGGGAFPDEILMVEAVDTAAADRVEAKLNARLADLTTQAQNYDADSLALFQKCKVERYGNVVTLFASPDSEQLRDIFTKAGK